jgi:hypothetical protein
MSEARAAGCAAQNAVETAVRTDRLALQRRIDQQLERSYEAFGQGKLSPERCDERLSRLQARLEDLRAQQAELSLSTPDEAGQAPTPSDLAAVVDPLEGVIANGEPQKSKALLRVLIQELRVNGRPQIQPTYRLITPEVCATSEKVGGTWLVRKPTDASRTSAQHRLETRSRRAGRSSRRGARRVHGDDVSARAAREDLAPSLFQALCRHRPSGCLLGVRNWLRDGSLASARRETAA